MTKFNFKEKIFLCDTDLTGLIYFSNLFKYAQKAFEAFIATEYATLGALFEQTGSLFPIVHAECDIQAPLQAGEELMIGLSLEGIGESSFTLKSHFKIGERAVATVQIVHVCVPKGEERGSAIPAEFRRFLERLK